jgi:hypothetical protein
VAFPEEVARDVKGSAKSSVLRSWLPDAARDPISIAGAMITTIAAGLFLFVFFADLFGIHTNPYLGMVFFLIMPSLFVFGLLLIPIGVAREHYLVRRGRAPVRVDWPVLDLRDERTRRIAGLVCALTLVNILIVSLAAYKGLEYMDSVEFCGQLCHEVMEPEFAAYQDGPHSRVKCVDCHIGEGASWFVRSKLSGTRQIFAVLFNTHARPIPTPVRDLRPARETCEQCHWPDKFHGDKIDVRREYAPDEQNSVTATTLRLHVGGASADLGSAVGIHWHTYAANVIEYIAVDDKRQEIPWVRLTDRTGRVREYVVPGTTDEQLARGERRTMDCVDCHNRPTHAFSPSPERAVDLGLSSGMIPAALPYVRREGVALLKAEYPSREAALASIEERLMTFYQTNYPELATREGEAVRKAIQGLQRLYARNVFPRMRVTWGTHINNLGHMDSPGCFRCHDDNHKTADGEVIRQDCDLCHTIE